MTPLATRPLEPSARQSVILREIITYHRTTSEACRASYLARRFAMSRTTVRMHLETLYRKGWLASPTSPVLPTRNYLIRH